jgi:ubiquinone/menaquinone biosynthesis C-methylase UbiE
MKPSNYDNVAGFYDRLSRLIFGNSIIDAQVCLLPFIPADSHILIIGGGTGWILEKIAERHPHGLNIDYVESSSKMIVLSQKRYAQGNVVHFIHQPIEDFSLSKKYEVIITPFLFDNFSADLIDQVFPKLDESLDLGGLWLFADFTNNSGWQKLLLRSMYLFFRITGSVFTHELVPMEPYFTTSYQKEFGTYHYFRFIQSIAYRKANL